MFFLGKDHTAKIRAAGKAHLRFKVSIRRLNYPILLFNMADEKNFTRKGLLRQGEVGRVDVVLTCT